MTADKKVQKYDRQLRLWQAHGQAALEDCKLLMIGSNNLSSEVLKNLILPGIGSYTVLDDKLVAGEDVGSNFFLLSSNIGESRAKATCQLLQELNDQVRGNYDHRSVREMLSTDLAYLDQFTIVVYCGGFTEKDMLDVGSVCLAKKIPFLISQIYGFLGYCRLAAVEHTVASVVESHPESIVDLRLDMPWPKLASLVKEYDFSNMTPHIASHIPFPALILEALFRWRLEYNSMPTSKVEKDEFKILIKSLVGECGDDENLREAFSHCYKLFAGTQLPSHIQEYMGDDSCLHLTKDSAGFWILLHALKRFVENEGQGALPLSGVIPDMKADTDSYVALQRIYHEKAHEDLSYFKKHLEGIMNEIGMSNSIFHPGDIERFCKNSGFLKIIRFKSLAEEYSLPISESLRCSLDEDDSDSVFYILLRVANRFHALHGHYPGAVAESFESDSLAFEALFSAFSKEIGVELSLSAQIKEVIRAGSCELPSMAALMGGIVSQEVIKLITHQYVPLDNALIFNGVKSTTCIFKV